MICVTQTDQRFSSPSGDSWALQLAKNATVTRALIIAEDSVLNELLPLLQCHSLIVQDNLKTTCRGESGTGPLA